MTDDRERWALILGASSGMGEATARTLAGAGYRICGIHLDFRAALAHVDEVKSAISMGYWFTSAPQVHNGVIYIGSTRSESHIPGGHVLAVDARAGSIGRMSQS